MLPEPEDDENDMLDMAFGLTDTFVPQSFLVGSALTSELVQVAVGLSGEADAGDGWHGGYSPSRDEEHVCRRCVQYTYRSGSGLLTLFGRSKTEKALIRAVSTKYGV